MQKPKKKIQLPLRVATIAGNSVSLKGEVSVIDLMLGLSWLTPDKLKEWQAGKIPYLERVITANLTKISRAMKAFRAWAVHSKLKPSIRTYKHKKNRLRFSKTSEANIEMAYATHYVLVKPTKKQIPTDVMCSNASSNP